MGGNLFNTCAIKGTYVRDHARIFMMSVIQMPDLEHHITGSFRRGAEYCGDIELVFVPKSDEEKAELMGKIAKQFGCNKSTHGPKLNGQYGCVQFDLHIASSRTLGAMLLHTTGSYAFNIVMRRRASERGLLLNQYGLFNKCTREPVVLGSDEERFFKYLDMDFVDPKDRSKENYG